MTNNSYFIGADISANHGAIVYIDSNADHVLSVWYTKVKSLVKPSRIDSLSFRLMYSTYDDHIRYCEIGDIFNHPTLHEFDANQTFIAIENFGFQSQKLSILAQATGIFKYAFCNCSDMIKPSPTQLKKYATTNGTAQKEEMIEAAIKNCSYDPFKLFGFKEDGNLSVVEDLCDAYFLARYSRDYQYATKFGAGVEHTLDTSSSYSMSVNNKKALEDAISSNNEEKEVKKLIKKLNNSDKEFREKFLCVK